MKLSRVALLAATALLSATRFAGAQAFNQAVVFGDSTLDDGWFRFQPCTGGPTLVSLCNASIAAGGGVPSTPFGPTKSDVLASHFGLLLNTADASAGGTNFAASGASSNNRNVNPDAPSTLEQINSYLTGNGGVANPNALYLIGSGSNDLKFAGSKLAAGKFTGAQAEAYVVQAARDLASGITGLHAAGARYIIVNDAPNSLGPRALLNLATLWSTLAANGVPFIPADYKSAQQVVLNNGAQFGFSSVSDVDGPGGTACINPNPSLIKADWALYCTPALLRSPNAAQTSYMADQAHLSAGGQRVEADYLYSLVIAPSEISYLAEVPVKTRAGVVGAIDNQIPISLRQAGQYHAWVSGDVSWLKMSNAETGFPDDPGAPVSTTAGFDFRVTPNWLVGAAFSGGTTKQTFSLGGGFTLDEFAVSAYAAYLDGPLWGIAIASAGGLLFDTNRQVPIGITVQPNNSKAGSNLSLALETGYDFSSLIGTAASPMRVKAAPAVLAVKHGPVVGITLQQVHVDGFTESDQFAAVGGMTALEFAGQTRNSAVSELGYRASMNIGIWHPFAKLAWNHEWANTDRQVTAFLTTPFALAVGAPGYSMPAVIFGKDWGTAALGSSVKVSRNVTGLATFGGQLAERSIINYGGQVGFNVALDPTIVTDMPVKVPRLK